MAVTAVLARILSPREYGLVAMVAVLTSFFQLFADAGLSWATIQSRNITREQVNNLFWLNVGAGSILWLVCALSGPILNAFYRRTDLAPIALVMGAGFVLSGLAAQPAALLRRQMRIGALAWTEGIASLLGALVGVAMAWAQMGYWALVGQSLAYQAFMLLPLYAYTGFAPRIPRLRVGTRALLAFGGLIAGFNVLSYFSNTLDNILVGRFLGPEQLGYYSRAYFLVTVPGWAVSGCLNLVLIPTLCAFHGQRREFERTYIRAVALVAYCTFPMTLGLLVTCREAVLLQYGPAWTPVVPILGWLAIGGLFSCLHTFPSLYVVSGNPSALCRWGLISVCVYGVAFAIGVQFGVIGVAKAYTIVTALVTTPLGIYLAHRAVGMGVGPLLTSFRRPLAASLVMAAGSIVAGEIAVRGGMAPAAIFACKVVTGALVYAVLTHANMRSLLAASTLHSEGLSAVGVEASG
jgi:O-antigen/teichoic acid export membrane protein